MNFIKQLGERFLSSSYCRRAFTHRSVSVQNNERLEYLGDSLLGFFIADWLYKHYSTYSEGDLTRLRAHLVRKETLAAIAREQDLGDFLVLGAGELKSGGVRRDSILADTLEALIGAVYLSDGFERARTFVLDLYATRLQSIPAVDQLKDAKTRLQELLQSNGVALPEYMLKEKLGKSGNEIFTVECKIKGCAVQFMGTGSSRRQAEQDAAEHAHTYMSNQNSST